MPSKPPSSGTGKARKEKYIKYHNDGTVWARGSTLNGKPHGYFEWFRKNGAIMRSGWFEKGEQTGVWTTYDRNGKVYKVTEIKKKSSDPPGNS